MRGLLNWAKQRGLSLVEVMVALVISLVLLAGVVQIFGANKQTYRLADALSSMQENARFAVEVLTQDIRMAGFQGCAPPGQINPHIAASLSPTNNLTQTALQGFAASGEAWSPALPFTDAQMVNNSDVIAIQRGSNNPAPLLAAMNGTTGDLILASNQDGIDENNLALVSSCASADIFRVSAISGNILKHTDALSATYPAHAQAMRFTSHFYAVRDSGRRNAAGQRILSLYRWDTASLTPMAAELVEGVDNFQVRYGEVVGDNIRYTTASNITNMAKVTSVKIALLFAANERTLDVDDTTRYVMHDALACPANDTAAGCTINYPNDRRLRRVFSTTIQLRNRSTQAVSSWASR